MLYLYLLIYLNYNLVPFNIKNLDGLKTHRHAFRALFPMSLPCHFAIPIHSSNLYLNIS